MEVEYYMTNENKIKHLEFIQNVITRLNSNSFMIKGWCVTLIAALFALAAKDSEVKFAVIAYFIIPIFWILDGFFLTTEKAFRKMYNQVRVKEESEIDFEPSLDREVLEYNFPSAEVLMTETHAYIISNDTIRKLRF